MGAAGVCSPVSFPVSLVLGGVWLSYSCSLFFPRTDTAPTTQAWAALRPAAAAASASRTRGLCQEDLSAVRNPLTKAAFQALGHCLGSIPCSWDRSQLLLCSVKMNPLEERRAMLL